MRTRLKNGVYARSFGASELMLASLLGSYPPPHRALDDLEQEMRHADVRPRLPELPQTHKAEPPKQMELLLV